jgi:hypothetical protein
MEVKRYIENDPRYAAFVGNIHGANFPPSSMAVFASYITTTLWLIGLALLFAGDQIFKTLQLREPDWYRTMKENKMMVCSYPSFIIDEIILFVVSIRRLAPSFSLTVMETLFLQRKSLYSVLEFEFLFISPWSVFV